MPRAHRVAIVEDDPSSRKTLLRVLQAGGFEPVIYENAEDYLKSPPIPAPMGLLLDMNLGGMSGLDLQAALNSRGSTVPVIVITGVDDPDFERESRRLGCLEYFHKPCDASAILGILNSLVS